MHQPDIIDTAAAAAEAGVCYDTFRKQWRAWSDPDHPTFCQFPAPCRYPPPGRRGSYGWRRTAITEWKLARERAFGAAFVRPEGVHVSRQKAASALTPTVLRQRAAMARMMESR